MSGIVPITTMQVFPQDTAGLALHLEHANHHLIQADNIERLQIRDDAGRMKVAAAVMGRRDIAHKFNGLMRRAEWWIAQTPKKKRGPKQEDQEDNGDSFLSNGEKTTEVLSESTLHNLRSAYKGITFEELGEKLKDSEAHDEYLTQTRLREEHAAKLREERKAKRKAEREERVAETELTNDRIFAVAIADLSGHVEAGSLDAIVTDPPYPREYLPVWRDLAEFAVHALRPGGMLIAMSGVMFLPEVIGQLSIDGLSYRWIISYYLPGGAQHYYGVNAISSWKPVLVFRRDGGKQIDGCSRDVVVSDGQNAMNKRFHDWGQSASVMADILSGWVPSPAVVMDPFCGGGSTLVAAKRLGGYKFLGSDIDADCVVMTQKAIEETKVEAMAA